MTSPVSSSTAAPAAARPRTQNRFGFGILVLALSLLMSPVLMSGHGNAADARITKSMAALKDQAAKLGAPTIKGTDAVGGKDAPALFFGATGMNNNFSVVDEVAKEGGQGMAATLFVKGGDEFIRVATTLPSQDGSGRAVGTALAGPALDAIKAGKPYYGEAEVLGMPYVSGYEPIKDASGAVIGRLLCRL